MRSLNSSKSSYWVKRCFLIQILIILLLASGCWIIKKPTEEAEIGFDRSRFTIEEGSDSVIRLVSNKFDGIYAFEVVLEAFGGVEITAVKSLLDELLLIAGCHTPSQAVIHGAFPYDQQEARSEALIEIEIRATKSGTLRIRSHYALDVDLSVVNVKSDSSTVEVTVR